MKDILDIHYAQNTVTKEEWILDSECKLLYYVLCQYRDNATNDQECSPSIKELVRSLCLSKSTVLKRLKVLKGIGLITIRNPTKEGRIVVRNIYTILRPFNVEYVIWLDCDKVPMKDNILKYVPL